VQATRCRCGWSWTVSVLDQCRSYPPSPQYRSSTNTDHCSSSPAGCEAWWQRAWSSAGGITWPSRGQRRPGSTCILTLDWLAPAGKISWNSSAAAADEVQYSTRCVVVVASEFTVGRFTRHAVTHNYALLTCSLFTYLLTHMTMRIMESRSWSWAVESSHRRSIEVCLERCRLQSSLYYYCADE